MTVTRYFIKRINQGHWRLADPVFVELRGLDDLREVSSAMECATWFLSETDAKAALEFVLQMHSEAAIPHVHYVVVTVHLGKGV